MKELLTGLSDKLSEPLPGTAAQFQMAHQVRRQEIQPPITARKAGVLVLLYPKQEHWHLVLIRRRSNVGNDRHAGQVSFPGGAFEQTDPSLEYTALREAAEEVGAPVDRALMLGQLSQLYIPVSNFLVFPFVAQLDFTPELQADPSEVEYIIETPLSVLLNSDNQRKKNLRISKQMTLKEVPYYAVGEHVVWGATAMMLSELLTVISR